MATPPTAAIEIRPDLPICQTDLPLDHYQDEFRPYAEEYLALPDRKPDSVLPWMDRYIEPALGELGDRVMLLAHYYMGGEIVKLVERYGGQVADSYQLARQAVLQPDCELFVESAVHFMAESIALLASPEQQVYITNPRSGCTMEMMAKEFMLVPAYERLAERFGDDVMVVAYMNTSGRAKALAGRSGGAVCTSSNAGAIMRWALEQGRRIFFIPDEHLGRNVAKQVGIPDEEIFQWPGGHEGADFDPSAAGAGVSRDLERSRLILWGSFCGVHTVFTPEQAGYWQERGHTVLVHPECPRPVVDAADGAGSTSYLWNRVSNAEPGECFAVGTEGHFVQNLREQMAPRGVEVVHMAEIPGQGSESCGCATMSRNDPPHLVAMLDLLRRGEAPDANRVEAGDAVDEVTGSRDRLSADDRAQVAVHARKALERMIEITEAAS